MSALVLSLRRRWFCGDQLADIVNRVLESGSPADDCMFRELRFRMEKACVESRFELKEAEQ